MSTVFDAPVNLSPSRIDAFTTCPMAFRFSCIERLPEPPSPHTTKGSLVHRVLELLFTRPPHERTERHAALDLDTAWQEFSVSPDLVDLHLDEADAVEFRDDAWRLVQRYFTMESPQSVHPLGLEVRLEADLGAMALRGIIDRLDIEPDGSLVVVDYKSGKAPPPQFRQQRMVGVHLYALLCQRVLGVAPRAVRLMYLGSGDVIESAVTDQSVRFAATRATAVFRAVETACARGDFRPRPGPLCNGCAFRSWCPAFDGDPSQAARDLAATA